MPITAFRRLAACAAALLLAACATPERPFVPGPASVQLSPVDAPFSAAGRIAVNADGRGHYGNFEWRHAPDRDELSILSPVGSTVARLTRDGDGVALEADGKTHRAPDVETLTEETLGYPLPLENLVWWIRGLPAPDEPAERVDGGIAQQGWRIRFVADEGGSPVPRRVEMVRDGLSIRLVTHRWQ
ncbi:outer membrane lipoprotein LolB [Crenobacter luteus]|uniref:Outer-membrane lipoprotein LolB n=1 Tax=Crenobacter luteus TaxID=1452487 RepID=A0A165FJ45_9NEIS|nr:lipoprotein insertase outer membrane protein LolB [Crenobacter luteus]KZE33434.1 lipoprotein localization factor LolB [Crenobacter luteus]TCP10941.1 outer membrane lipoprotein LolB [Crenobacter luteus]